MAKGFKTGGRQKGSRNKATRAIKEIAGDYSDEAVDTLVKHMRGEDARVSFAAAQELLNRAHGKPTTHIEADITTRSVMRMPAPAKDADAWTSTLSGNLNPAHKQH